MSKLKRVFIANRGEISARIATTAKRMGIETVAITDKKHPPAFLQELITHFVYVENETTATYLDADFIIELAKKAQCDAIHPGFGFLSENAQFAKKVVEHGMIWIGPTHDAISAMASKATARELAMASGVPCVKGLQNFHIPHDLNGDFSILEKFAEEAGYPLLIKAALGGGGKGMRLVRQKSELKDAAFRARSEALNSFGDEGLIIERYVEAPRHIEVQIMADAHGNVAAIGDRDCSVQRRHQKILEEAPAPQLTTETRRALHQSAIDLAKKVGYRSAGTVEFLLDWSAGKMTEKQEYFFLEMNTRLQVEHPVTEEVYGMDLVEWQFRVAQGEKLPESFFNLSAQRHSIEARFYAEDVDSNFFPSPGKVLNFTPHHDIGVRWEIGLDTIDEITSKFDPMVAKVIATGQTREIALSKLCNALENTVFAGPANNLEFLMDICRHSPFAHGPVDTHFIDKNFSTIVNIRNELRHKYQSVANEILELIHHSNGQISVQHSQKEPTISQVTANAFAKTKDSNVPILKKSQITISKTVITQSSSTPQIYSVAGLGIYTTSTFANLPFHYAFIKTPNERQYWVFIEGRAYKIIDIKKSWEGGTSSTHSLEDITAPVPGKVIKIIANTNNTVECDQTIFVLESMKMEFEVKAAKSGLISKINVTEGEQVTTGQLLATWTE